MQPNITCPQCGKNFYMRPSRRAVFCSPACRYAGMTRPPIERFWEKVVQSDGCWEWTAARTSAGYGEFAVATGQMIYAHRFMWTLHFGPIPEGMFICHHCDNPPCVRPDHLFIGAASDNHADMRHKGRGSNPPTGKGEANHAARLTSSQALDILTRLEQGETQTSLAREYNVHLSTVHLIKNRRNWTDLRQ
jgi:hypothetical protein